MTKTLAIVGARLNSNRLAGKHLLPLAGEPMISHIWRRLMRCNEVNSLELATTADHFNRPLLYWANEHRVECHPYEGDVNDLMARLDKIIQRQDPDYILYVCGDCPLIDPEFIDHGLKALKRSAKDAVMLEEGIRTLHEGLSFYSRNGWNKLMAASQCTMSREHVGYADKLTPVLDRVVICDSGDYGQISHRISVDTQADYRFMAETYRRWYTNHESDSIVSLAWVQQQLLQDSQLTSINAHVTQKAADKQYAKASLYCHLGADIGLGHFRRIELIADALQEYLGIGSTIHVLYDGEPLSSSSTKLHWYRTEQSLLDAMSEDKNPLLVLDFHPEFIAPTSLTQALKGPKQHGAKLVGIDKLSPLIETLNRLFIPSFYTALTDNKVSYGWQNYLFRARPNKTKQRQVLVLTGGSDALGYGARLPTMLTELGLDWPITWIQGPLAPTPNIPQHSNIKLLQDPQNLDELIAGAEVILTCYGLSLFEAIYSGAATLLLPPKHLVDLDELQRLRAENCCIISESLEHACAMLTESVARESLREALQTQSKQVFADHRGIKQLMAEIKMLMAND
ncbi:cytidylyltransferase domain-containing protein [Shewanella aquimarina]|uniref:cytidylyltransferase domain-containing protein n=1 Tax=Shewanella aquimarina TaxID=260365 RepID=UPI002014C7A6|nr:NTP transferase domain-containing protein [Shewanella aquimarina]MCL2910787.1 NTP transferase domain-containing protein [Shewanella aquimarina]